MTNEELGSEKNEMVANDETDYLLSSSENEKWLLESIEQLKRGETVKYELWDY